MHTYIKAQYSDLEANRILDDIDHRYVSAMNSTEINNDGKQILELLSLHHLQGYDAFLKVGALSNGPVMIQRLS